MKVAILFLALCSIAGAIHPLSKFMKRQGGPNCNIDTSQHIVPPGCSNGSITAPVEVCRECVGIGCEALTGDVEECKALAFNGCKALGVEVDACSSALALVTIRKGVLAVVLLAAAFLVF